MKSHIKTYSIYIIIFIQLIFIFSQSAFAKKYYIIRHKVKPGQNMASILKKYILIDSVLNKKTPMMIKTTQNNPHIKNLQKLRKGVTVKLYISAEFINLTIYKRYQKKYEKNQKRKNKKKKKSDNIASGNIEKPSSKKSFGMSLFYMLSLGKFTQTATDTTVTTLSQNSPFTLGSLVSYRPKRKKYFYSGSLYVSYLTEFKSNVSNEKTAIPPEVGINVYYNYTGLPFLQALYAGLDYEKFSPFNPGTILLNEAGENTAKIGFDTIYVLYLTAGIGKVFGVFRKPVFMKISLSKSIFTVQSAAEGGTPLDKKYSGFRSIFYMNYRVSKRYFVHGFYKIHLMSGPNKLNISRYGIGFGANLF